MTRFPMKSLLGAAVISAAILLLPAPAEAQEEVSIYALLSPRGGILTPGEPVEGALTAADPISESGRRVQVWVLHLEAGDEVQVDLEARDFDAYLQVVGPGLGQGLTDDDGGDGLDARLCFQAAQAGEYRVVAGALGGEAGGFSLAVRPNAGGLCGAATGSVEVSDLTLLPVEGRTLVAGEPVAGSLGDGDPAFYGSPVQAWIVPGRAGEPFSVDLVSEAFDAYLTVLGPGLDDWLTDDDGAGRCDARVSLTFPQDGEYRVVVGTIGAGTGAFTLLPAREAGPVSPEPCVPVYAEGEQAGDTGSLDDVAMEGSVAIPGRVTGSFRGGEARFRGRPLQGWTLDGSADQRVAVTLTSDDFDAYLFFRGPGFAEPVTDDDSAGGLNARLCVELPEDGSYGVYAGPLSDASSGDRYELEVLVGTDADALCQATFQVAPARVADALSRLDPGGRVVEVDGEAGGALGADADTEPEGGQPIQPWLLRGTPGTTVWADVVSDAFDATVRAVWPGIAEPLFNDDFGEGCNSRVEITLPASGEVILLPGAYTPGSTGSFLLRVSTDPGPLEVGGCGAGGGSAAGAVDAGVLEGVTPSAGNTLEVGLDILAFLDEGGDITVDGKPAQAWSFQGRAGDDMVFEVLSDDFDPVLWVGGPGMGSVLFDDDSAGSLDPRIEVTLTASGRFTVVVGALGDGTGSFRIRVLRRAGS